MLRILSVVLEKVVRIGLIILLMSGLASLILNRWTDTIDNYFLVVLVVLIMLQHFIIPLMHENRMENVKKVLREEYWEEYLKTRFGTTEYHQINFSKRGAVFGLWCGVCFQFLLWLLLLIPKFTFWVALMIIIHQALLRFIMNCDFRCRDFVNKQDELKWRRLTAIFIPVPFVEILYYFSVAKKIPLKKFVK